MRGLALAALLALIALASPARAQQPTSTGTRIGSGLQKDDLVQVGFDQHLGGALPMDAAFVDEAGKAVHLSDAFPKGGAKPVIVVLVYNDCPMLCSLVLSGVVGSLRAVKTDVGKDFDVLVVSFDPKDTPEIASKQKARYVRRYGRPGSAQGFHFWTGKEADIHRLTSAIGFNYRYDEKMRQFAHPSGIVIATPDGTLARYLFGAEFSPKDVGFALSDASNGKVGTLATQVLMLCYRYDPVKGTYAASAMTALRVGGVLTIAALLGFMWASSRKKPAATVTT